MLVPRPIRAVKSSWSALCMCQTSPVGWLFPSEPHSQLVRATASCWLWLGCLHNSLVALHVRADTRRAGKEARVSRRSPALAQKKKMGEKEMVVIAQYS